MSSAVVEGGKYALTGFDFGESTMGAPEFGETDVVSVAFDNTGSDSRGQATVSLVKGKEQSWNLSNWQETTAGVSSTIEFSNEGSLSAVVAGTYTASFTASLETALGSQKDEGSAKYQESSTEVVVDPDGGCFGGGRMTFTPVTAKFNVTLTYSEVDENGRKVPGGSSYTKTTPLEIKSSKHSTIEKHSFCPRDVAEKMVNNRWGVRGSADKNLMGSFTEIPNSDKLKWTNLNGQSLTLTPKFNEMCYTTSDLSLIHI